MKKKCLSISYSAIGSCTTKKFIKVNGFDRVVSFDLDYVSKYNDVYYSYSLMNLSDEDKRKYFENAILEKLSKQIKGCFYCITFDVIINVYNGYGELIKKYKYLYTISSES